MTSRTLSLLVALCLAVAACRAADAPVTIIAQTAELADGGLFETTGVVGGYTRVLDCLHETQGDCTFTNCPGDAGELHMRTFDGIVNVADGGTPAHIRHGFTTWLPVLEPDSTLEVNFTPDSAQSGAVPAFHGTLQMPSKLSASIPRTLSRSQDTTLSLPALANGRAELNVSGPDRTSVKCTFSSTVGVVPARLLAKLPNGPALTSFGSVAVTPADSAGSVLLEGHYSVPVEAVTLTP